MLSQISILFIFIIIIIHHTNRKHIKHCCWDSNVLGPNPIIAWQWHNRMVKISEIWFVTSQIWNQIMKFHNFDFLCLMPFAIAESQIGFRPIGNDRFAFQNINLFVFSSSFHSIIFHINVKSNDRNSIFSLSFINNNNNNNNN